ncbi:SMI1/KNR4 family protein [Streptomyces sp. NPDC003480]
MTEETAARQITDAWRRIERWLGEHAPATYAALGPGASDEQIAAVDAALGLVVPVELRTLWGLVSGGNVDGSGPWQGNAALLSLDEVVNHYRSQMVAQAGFDAGYEVPGVPGEGDVIVWQPGWIPVFSSSAYDTLYGTYLDAGTGLLWRWTRETYVPPGPDDPQDSLVTCLEGLADALEYPALAQDRPGLLDGALVWESAAYGDEDWRPV